MSPAELYSNAAAALHEGAAKHCMEMTLQSICTHSARHKAELAMAPIDRGVCGMQTRHGKRRRTV